MNSWLSQLQQLLQSEGKVVMVTVASVKGSTPREPGARMLVAADDIYNTIGGGHLEYKAIKIARNMLAQDSLNELQNFSLGAGLGQCCGGVVTLFFEVVTDQSSWVNDLCVLNLKNLEAIQVIPVDKLQGGHRMLVTEKSVMGLDVVMPAEQFLIQLARVMLNQSQPTTIKSFKAADGSVQDYVFDRFKKEDFKLFLFGAGHVGQALVKLLEQQPCQVSWVDTRDDQLPVDSAENITTLNTDVPQAVIDEAPAGSYFLVMTHDHSLDQSLTEQILKRNDFVYFGLIGSATKRKRFEHRMLRRGFSSDSFSKMTCPIGIQAIHSKYPAAIALSVMAELLQIYEQQSMKTDDWTNTEQQAGLLI